MSSYGKHLKFKSEVLNKEIDVYLEDQQIAEYYPVLTYLIGIDVRYSENFLAPKNSF